MSAFYADEPIFDTGKTVLISGKQYGHRAIPLSRDGRNYEIEEPCRVAAEDRSTLDIVEPRRALDHADRIHLSHIGRIVGGHQDVIGAVLVDEIIELVMGVDERVEVDPLQISGRHPMQLLAAIRARRR